MKRVMPELVFLLLLVGCQSATSTPAIPATPPSAPALTDVPVTPASVATRAAVPTSAPPSTTPTIPKPSSIPVIASPIPAPATLGNDEREWDRAVTDILQNARKGQSIILMNVLITRVTRPTPGQTVVNISVIKSVDFQTGKANSSVLAVAHRGECLYQEFQSKLIQSGPRGFFVLDQRVPQLQAKVELPITSLSPAELVLVWITTSSGQTVSCT